METSVKGGPLLAASAFADERMPQRNMHAEEGGFSGQDKQQPGNLPAHYPRRFDRQGVMRSIVTAGKVMIGGVRYTVSPNVRVHTLDPAGRNVVAIWVLPKGSVPQN